MTFCQTFNVFTEYVYLNSRKYKYNVLKTTVIQQLSYGLSWLAWYPAVKYEQEKYS